MMQQIFRNQTQDPIFGYPSDLNNFWSRAFIRVGTPSHAMPDESSWTAAQIDRAARGVTALCKEGTTTITHSPIGVTAFTVGNQYIVDLANGDPSFIVKLTHISSTSTFETQDPLPQDIPSGSSIRGFRVSFELDPDQVTDVGEAIARWLRGS